MSNKKRPTITAHCIVKNEENWIWYAINSVIDFVDRIFIYDTGSTDKTVKIIKSINSPKVFFEEKGKVSPFGLTKLRQRMLDKTETDWFLILDGDDIWPKQTIKELKEKIKKAAPEKEVVIVRPINCLGDVFHYSKKLSTERFPGSPKGLTGWMSSRAIKKDIEGLHCFGLYGAEGYADKNGLPVDQRGVNKLIFIKGKYFHMTHLQRSSSLDKDREVLLRIQKRGFFKGASLPKETAFPEVFYIPRPKFVPSPLKRLTWLGEFKGLFYRACNFVERLKNNNTNLN